jgi:hypothetical protein
MWNNELTNFGRLTLFGSGVYHVAIGILSMLSVNFTRRVAGKLYSLKIPQDLDPRYEYLWKPLGAYAVWVGAFCFRALWVDEIQFQHFVIEAMAAMYLVRAFQRFYYRELFERAFQVTFRRNLINITFNIILALSMLVFS